jgi:hypothetical protein
VDAVLRGGYRDPHTTGHLVFVLLRSALLGDEDAVGVRHVREEYAVDRETKAVRPLPGVACACGAHCS